MTIKQEQELQSSWLVIVGWDKHTTLPASVAIKQIELQLKVTNQQIQIANVTVCKHHQTSIRGKFSNTANGFEIFEMVWANPCSHNPAKSAEVLCILNCRRFLSNLPS